MKNKALKTVGLMAAIILTAKISGLLREVLIAAIYGRGDLSDIINTSTQIPLLIFDMTLGVAILSTFVPVFNKFLEQSGKERAMKFACNFMTVVTLFAIVAATLGAIFSAPIVRAIAGGYSQDKIDATAALLKILFPSIIFTAMAYVSVGFLQSFEEFTVPSLISLVSNLIMIFYLVIFKDKFGITGVIVSMLIAWISQFFIQIPVLIKKGFTYKFTLDFKDEGIREAAKIALPVLISSWVNPICSMINMSFGSSLGDGAVSGLNWAYKIYIIMVGVFAYAITNFIFPKLSRLSAGDDDAGFAHATRQSVGWIIIIIAVVAALFISLANPVIKVVFERGNFTAADTAITGEALFFYSFGMIGYAVCEVLNKSFYAIGDGKTPMFTSIFGIVVNFAAAAIFTGVFRMGVGGLALATAISSTAIAFALMVMINRRKRGVITKGFAVNCFKAFIAAAAACITAKLIYLWVDGIFGSSFIITLLKLCIASIPAVVVYFIIGFTLKVDELRNLRKNGDGGVRAE